MDLLAASQIDVIEGLVQKLIKDPIEMEIDPSGWSFEALIGDLYTEQRAIIKNTFNLLDVNY